MKTINELSKLYYDIALECKQKYYIPNTDITRAKKLRKYQILYRNNLIIKKHGKDYKIHLDNFKKLMNLKSLLYKHIDTV